MKSTEDSFEILVTRTEDGRYVIINSEGKTVPLKVSNNTARETPEGKKYVVRSKFIISLST